MQHPGPRAKESSKPQDLRATLVDKAATSPAERATAGSNMNSRQQQEQQHRHN